MLTVLCAAHDPTTTVLAVEEAFRVPLIDPESGELLERDLVGSLDRLEQDADRLTVVDLKTATRRYTSGPMWRRRCSSPSTCTRRP